MSNAPPTAAPDPAWRVYARAGALLIPIVLTWLVANLFLRPTSEYIWAAAGLGGFRTRWLVDASFGLIRYSPFIGAGGVLLLLLLEFGWAAWPRYRRTVVASATWFANAAVLATLLAIAMPFAHTVVILGLTVVCIAAFLAAPLFIRPR